MADQSEKPWNSETGGGEYRAAAVDGIKLDKLLILISINPKISTLWDL